MCFLNISHIHKFKWKTFSTFHLIAAFIYCILDEKREERINIREKYENLLRKRNFNFWKNWKLLQYKTICNWKFYNKSLGYNSKRNYTIIAWIKFKLWINFDFFFIKYFWFNAAKKNNYENDFSSFFFFARLSYRVQSPSLA